MWSSSGPGVSSGGVGRALRPALAPSRSSCRRWPPIGSGDRRMRKGSPGFITLVCIGREPSLPCKRRDVAASTSASDASRMMRLRSRSSSALRARSSVRCCLISRSRVRSSCCTRCLMAVASILDLRACPGSGAGRGGRGRRCSAASKRLAIGGTPLTSPRRESRRPSKPVDGGGSRSNRGGRIVGSRVRRVRVVLRPWTEGRLRMAERRHAVGSAFAWVLLAFFSSGSRQILSKQVFVSLRAKVWTSFRGVVATLLRLRAQ